MLALFGLASACTTQGTGLVWRTPTGEVPQRTDFLACGAMIQNDGSTLVPPNLNATFGACMRSKGFVQTQGKIASTWTIGGPPPVRTDDPAFRRAMARNAPGVRINQLCTDLFIPVVQVEKFADTLTMWHLHFINNSSRRYVINVDVKYEEARERGSASNEEHTITIRPNVYMKFPLTNLPGKVTRVIAVDVFRCEFTEHTDTPLPAGVSPSQTAGARTPTQPPPPAIVANPPPSSSTVVPSTLDTMSISDAQRRLNAAGFDAGSPDGSLGPKTVRAIRAFQAARKLPITGQLNQMTISELAK